MTSFSIMVFIFNHDFYFNSIMIFIFILDSKLADRGIITQATLEATISKVLEQSAVFKLTNQIREINDRTLTLPDGNNNDSGTTSRIQKPLTRLFTFCNEGVNEATLHRVPKEFSFPSVSLLLAWQHWCCGNLEKGYPPFRELQPNDMVSKNMRKRLSDYKSVMKKIENEAVRQQIWTDRSTLPEVNEMFFKCVHTLGVDDCLDEVRVRRLSQTNWSTLTTGKRRKPAEMMS